MSLVRRARDLPLSSYAIIGDRRTAALVASDLSIDWWCPGRFDRPAVFCRILDRDRGGYLQLGVAAPLRTSRRYLDRTNVLVTDIESAQGIVRVTDAMPLPPEQPMIIRRVDGVAGEVDVQLAFVPTFDFARAATTCHVVQGGCRAIADGAELALWSPAAMRIVGGAAQGSFRVRAGETRWVILTERERVTEDVAARALQQTIAAWERWSAHGTYPFIYESIVRRSALVLDSLVHAPTGAIVAAPTTSLPEWPGGTRNWDYRFAWLRDASWLVSALMDLEYHDESMAFIAWLEALDLGGRPAAVFYDLDGEPPSSEQVLPHLRGYLDARPVRVGNAAAAQDQHDVFGEVIAAIHRCSDAMPSMQPLRTGLWRTVTALADAAAAHWEHQDRGIWEVRDTRRHFLSSRLLCWTALDRALSVATRDHLDGPLARWRWERQRSSDAVLRDGFDSELGAFTRAVGERELDASALLLPRYGLVAADDPRMTATVRAIEDHLGAGNGLLYRYRAPDGLDEPEGAFIACSFWLVDCLAAQGRIDDAHRRFEQVIACANDVGLLSEEIDPGSGMLLGNFPQAFTHLALIHAAVSLAKAERAASQDGVSRVATR